MKKIKKWWKNNKVLFVLFTILIICFGIILGVGVKYFVGSNKSNYGDRLEDIKKIKFGSKEKEEYESFFKDDQTVDGVKINVTGKIIYITINFKEGINLSDAENKALQSTEKISEEVQNVYDLNFTLIQEKTEGSDGFTIMGAKNKKRPSIVWNNNTPFEEDEENE